MEQCGELKKTFFFFKQREKKKKKSNIKNGWEQIEAPLFPALTNACLSQLLLNNRTRPIRTRRIWVPCADVGFLWRAETVSPGRSWSLNSSWPDCSGLSC